MSLSQLRSEQSMSPLTFRQSMALLHTWAGVIFGSLLFVIFFMGSLAVYDREIDRWMMPVTRAAEASNLGAPLSLDNVILPAVKQFSAGMALEQWYVVLPSRREPVARIRLWDTQGQSHDRFLDPMTAQFLPDVGTLGASSFFYPFHYSLNLRVANIGYWIVGIAGMVMLVLLVSGVVIHVRIVKDFFTFRRQSSARRSLLDLHNLSGVAALPFHFVITLSGLIILFDFYMPAAMATLYPNDQGAFSEETQGSYFRAPANRPGEPGSLDAMVFASERLWQQGEAGFVRIWHPGDANAYVEVSRKVNDRIRFDEQSVYFDAATGALLKYSPLTPAASVQRFFSGLHLTTFDHRLLRGLYFLAGLMGCVLIATGLIYWLEKRLPRNGENKHAGVHWVAGLTGMSVTGLMIATLSMLIANRLLPINLEQRANWEVSIFFLAWLLAGCHAISASYRHRQTRPPWQVHCWVVCILSASAPLLNWITTGDHPFKALSDTSEAVAGVDFVLLLTSMAAGVCASKLTRRDADTDAQSSHNFSSSRR